MGGGGNRNSGGGKSDNQSKTVIVRGKDGKLTAKKVNYVEVLEDVDHDNYPVYDYDSGRVITVSRFAVKNEHTSVGITPHAGKYRTKVPWVVDSGVQKSMMAEKHLGWIMAKNPDIQLHRSDIRF